VIRLAGFGLHGGRPSSIVLRRTDGPTTLGRGTDRATLRELVVRGGDRTTIATLPSGATIASIEHLLSAVAGTRAFSGLDIDIEGDEVPLLDGCAVAMVQAIDDLALPAFTAEAARVTRSAEVRVGDAVYAFSPTSSLTSIVVDVDFAAERFGRALSGRAAWSGDPEQFRRDIAPARTFGAARELDDLRARGLAAHVPVGAVVALDLDDAAWAPRDPGEPIRHKLLDLIGDLARLGAPLVGNLVAVRPSHRASSEALERAVSEGVVALASIAR
jgi:UDP-3-O-[3-hydroxymyristoyl] N-acetylglucosamine deacetylase